MALKYSLFGERTWLKIFGSYKNDNISNLVVDPRDNSIIVSGTTEGTFPGQNSRGLQDIFVRKYNSKGNVEWTIQFGTVGKDDLEDFSILSLGKEYRVVGKLSSRPFIGGITINGKLAWTRSIDANWNHVHVDNEGDIIAVDFTTTNVYDLPAKAAVYKYDSRGSLIWKKEIQARNGGIEIHAVTTDSKANIILAGKTTGSLPGQTKVKHFSEVNAFVYKISSDGKTLWAWQFVGCDGAGVPFISEITSDILDNVYILGADSLGAHMNCFYILKLDSQGNEGWLKDLGEARLFPFDLTASILNKKQFIAVAGKRYFHPTLECPYSEDAIRSTDGTETVFCPSQAVILLLNIIDD